MIDLAADEIASAAGAEVVARAEDEFPARAVIDSREIAAGDLFVGLPGARVDGGRFAADALVAGAWGVIVEPSRAAEIDHERGWVLAAADPLLALQRLARHWRRALGARVVGITGSTGKTSVKDITHALIPRRVHASPENYNTEIGLPLAILSAPPGTEVLVLEMAMRGLGQIAELCEIAEPEIGAITNIGPVHLELLGTLEAIAEAKAELLVGLPADGVAVVPADTAGLTPYLSEERRTISFGPGGDVFATESQVVDGQMRARIGTPRGEAEFRFPFTEAHNLTNALASISIAVALGIEADELPPGASRISFSRLRGEHVDAGDGIVVINDCYNANPVSMRAALDHLATHDASARRIAVLGEMAELGPQAESYHREAGAHARDVGVDLIVGVGEPSRAYAPDRFATNAAEAAPLVAEMLEPGDVVLVKGSRAVGLERVTDDLLALRGAGRSGDRP